VTAAGGINGLSSSSSPATTTTPVIATTPVAVSRTAPQVPVSGGAASKLFGLGKGRGEDPIYGQGRCRHRGLRRYPGRRACAVTSLAEHDAGVAGHAEVAMPKSRTSARRSLTAHIGVFRRVSSPLQERRHSQSGDGSIRRTALREQGLSTASAQVRGGLDSYTLATLAHIVHTRCQASPEGRRMNLSCPGCTSERVCREPTYGVPGSVPQEARILRSLVSTASPRARRHVHWHLHPLLATHGPMQPPSATTSQRLARGSGVNRVHLDQSRHPTAYVPSAALTAASSTSGSARTIARPDPSSTAASTPSTPGTPPAPG